MLFLRVPKGAESRWCVSSFWTCATAVDTGTQEMRLLSGVLTVKIAMGEGSGRGWPFLVQELTA